MKFLKQIAMAVLLVLATASCFAGTKSAAAVLSEANTLAQQQNKKVLVIFHASWCGWCKKYDEFLADPQMKKLMNDNYVIVHLTVLEDAPHKKDENAGGEALLEQFHGKDGGIPFMVITDTKGKMLINSNTEKNGTTGNTGYPAADKEIAWYMKMMTSTAPRLTKAQATEMSTWLTTHAPKNAG